MVDSAGRTFIPVGTAPQHQEDDNGREGAELGTGGADGGRTGRRVEKEEDSSTKSYAPSLLEGPT